MAHMQVMSEEEGLRGGWFSAKVLTLTKTEALVVYDELLTDDGHLSLSLSLSLFPSSVFFVTALNLVT